VGTYHPWLLLWQYALSRSSRPNYPASYEVVSIGSAWSLAYTTEWERQRHTVVLACVTAWLEYFAWMKNFVFFFAWKEACFASARWQWLLTLEWGHVTVVTIPGLCLRQLGNFRSFGMLLRRSWWNLLSWKCWLMVQQRCKCVILAPLH